MFIVKAIDIYTNKTVFARRGDTMYPYRFASDYVNDSGKNYQEASIYSEKDAINIIDDLNSKTSLWIKDWEMIEVC